MPFVVQLRYNGRMRDRTVAPVAGPDRRVVVALLAIIVLLGGALRLYRLDALSLWLDEGFSVLFTRHSWPVVLGLQGAYDFHPPLYFSLAKLAGLALPEVDAVRGVSWLAGTLTLPVVYALGARLLDARAGLIAALALAVSPPHLWFSQEGRPFAATTLAVGVSYLVLVGFYQTAGRGWAVAYGAAVLVALYLNYSALYALLPQVLLLGFIVVRQRRRAVPLFVAGIAAGAGYLPWVPQILATAGRQGADLPPLLLSMGTDGVGRADYLGITPDHLRDMTLSALGWQGNYIYYTSTLSTPWEQWPAIHLPLLASLALAVALGAVILARRGAFAGATVLALGAGTVVTAALISLIQPGFAMRTILPATLGWALLVGALGARVRLAGVVRALGWGLGLILVGLALAGVWVMVAGGYKQLWTALAADVQRAAAFGKPILVVRPVTATLIDVYAPGVLAPLQIPNLDEQPPASAAPDDLIWFAYHDSPRFAPFHEQLAALGYQRILHRYYERPLYLDLYAGPNAQPGHLLDLNGQFAGGAGDAPGWLLPPGSTLEPAPTGGRQLRLGGEGADRAARQQVAAQPGGLYTLAVSGQAALQADGQATVHLICQASGGAPLDGSTPEAPLPNDGTWHPLKVAVLCPPATSRLAVIFQATSSGPATFRALTLSEALPPAPPAP